jgi:sialidase-1
LVPVKKQVAMFSHRVFFVFAFAALSLLSPVVALVDLFVAYTSAAPDCYRQPILVVIDSMHLLAFAEGRTNGFCSGAADGKNSSIWLRRSDDGGASWTPGVMLYDSPPMPDYLSAVYDAKAHRVILLIMTSPNMQMVSDDGGVTWTKPTAAVVKLPPSVVSATPGVAHGLQIDGALCVEPTCDGQTGRLVVAFVCHAAKTSQILGDVSCPGCFSCLATSDDSGMTWTVAPGAVSTQDGSREASVVQLLSSARGGGRGAVIYATERNMGATPGHRWHAISFDGASSLTSFGDDPSIPDGDTKNWTGIVAGATRVGASVHIFTPQAPGERADLARFSSTDEAQTWSAGSLVLAGPAGYSDAGSINETHGAGAFRFLVVLVKFYE